jgi:hypothetical protein
VPTDGKSNGTDAKGVKVVARKWSNLGQTSSRILPPHRHRHLHRLQALSRRGCYRTTLECCKLLLALEPEDRLGALLLLLDNLAVRAGRRGAGQSCSCACVRMPRWVVYGKE